MGSESFVWRDLEIGDLIAVKRPDLESIDNIRVFLGFIDSEPIIWSPAIDGWYDAVSEDNYTILWSAKRPR